jgi:hypothetical protein
MLSYGVGAVKGTREGGDREAQSILIHPGSAPRPDYLCRENDPPKDLGVDKVNGLLCRSEMWFKIKRPDYGSGQLERDLIFYGLKIFSTTPIEQGPCHSKGLKPAKF